MPLLGCSSFSRALCRWVQPFVVRFAADVAPSMKDLESSETLARLYARKSAEWNEVDGGFSGLGIKSFLFPKGVSGG